MDISGLLDTLLTIRDTLLGFFIYYIPLWKALSVMVSLTLFAILCYTALQLKRLGALGSTAGLFMEVASVKKLSRHRTIKAWRQVQKRLELGDEAQLKLALIEADKIFDEILKLSGFKGETMADRMKNLTPAQIRNVSELWVAHKTRNRIVHEPDFHVSKEETTRLVKEYEKAFRDFELID